MFEAAVVRHRAANRQFGFLSLSLAAHTLVIAVVVAAGIASTRLPAEPPKQITPWVVAPAIPLAAGTQTPVARPRPPAAAPTNPAPAPPDTTPATIPSATDPVAASVSLAPSTSTGDGAGEPGVSNGAPNGMPLDAGVNAAPDASGPLPITGNVKAPIVIRRVEPSYPQVAIHAHMGGWVVVRCVIDKTGHIRDVRVVNSTFGAFEQPAIDAVGQWLFSPGSLNGQAVDTIFELTVRFQMR